jgi:hypothetical protein
VPLAPPPKFCPESLPLKYSPGGSPECDAALMVRCDLISFGSGLHLVVFKNKEPSSCGQESKITPDSGPHCTWVKVRSLRHPTNDRGPKVPGFFGTDGLGYRGHQVQARRPFDALQHPYTDANSLAAIDPCHRAHPPICLNNTTC